MSQAEKEKYLIEIMQRAIRPLMKDFFERMVNTMAKNQADLDNSIAALKTAVANFSANPPGAPDLTSEVADIDAVTAQITALTPAPAPAPTAANTTTSQPATPNATPAASA